MRHLKANTQVKVVIGPFVDVSDGFTPETGVTLSGADEAELMKHDAASVTDISAATWAAITGMDGYYNLTLTTSHTDTEGMLVIAVQDDDVCLPVRAEFMVLSEAAYASMYEAKDTGYMDVNVKAISEDTAAADNAELAFDGTGYGFTGCTMPTVTTLTDHTPQTGDSFAIVNGDHGLVSIQDDVDLILADTNELQGNQANWATATGFATEAKQDIIDTNVDAILVDTGTTLPATLSTIEGKVDTVDTNVDAILVDTNELQTNQGNWATATGFSTHNAADVADAVWDEAATGHTDAGKAGAQLWTDIDAILTDTGTTLPGTLTTIEGKVDTIDTNVDAVLVDTGTTLPATLSTIEGKVDTIDTNVDAVLVDTGTTLDGKLDTIDSNVDSVLTDTGTTLPATLSTIEGKVDAVDTNVDAVLVDTSTTLDGKINTIDTVVDGIVTDIAALNDIQVSDITGAEVDNDGTAISLAGAFKLILSILTGESGGGGTSTLTFRDIADSKTRVSVTVDANGNRTAVGTRDAT